MANEGDRSEKLRNELEQTGQEIPPLNRRTFLKGGVAGFTLLAGNLAGAALRGGRTPKGWTTIAVAGIALVVALRLARVVPVKFALLGALLGLVASVVVPWFRTRMTTDWGDASDDVSCPEV